MNTLHLAAPRFEDADELFDFEVRNRAFFEARINSRPGGYYSQVGVAAAIEAAVEDAAADRAYQYLARNAAGIIVGRVNLTRVRRTNFHSADLGYRIGESECGKGYGTECVRQALGMAFGVLRLVRIEAVTRPENLGSARILANFGFREYGRSLKSFQLGDVWYDSLHFELRAYA